MFKSVMRNLPSQPFIQKYSRTWISALLLTVAIASLYGQFLWNPILFDDLAFFTIDNEGNQPVSTYHFSPFELRSLPYATLAWGTSWFGVEMFHFRIENLLLHAAVTLTLYFLLAKLFAATHDECNEAGLNPQPAAFFAALLFALHPVATYAAGYLVQRTIIMATLFGLLSMLAYLHGSIRRKPLWLWMSVPFYYLAAFSKEHAIMLPFALLALTVLLHGDWRNKLKQRWGIFAALAAIALFVLLAKKGLLGSVYEINAPEMLGEIDSQLSYPLSVITQSWLFFKYTLLWLFPNPTWMSVDMREPFVRSLLSPYLIATVCFVAWGVGAIWLLFKQGRAGLAGFALLFPWLMFFTEFSSVRIQEVFVLYRSYLWAAGAFCLLPVVFARVNARTASLILAIIALAMLPVSMERLMTFSHPVLLWDDAEKLVKERTDLPGAYRIYYNRGTELVKIDQPDKAIADFKQAIALRADFPAAYGNMGSAYLKKMDWQNAVISFNTAIEIADKAGAPQNPRHFYGRALAYEEMGNTQQAINNYAISCQFASKGCEKLPPTTSATKK
ncbi:MAG: tetratricopeptide repeat protein [Gallionella sp.]|nr:tetratricopeptide repeat protein [Gallionella sp.]